MRELKILGVVVFFTLVLYIGIEPFAHSKLQPAVAPANFNMQEADVELAKVRITEAEESLKTAEKDLEKIQKKFGGKPEFQEDIESAQKAVESAKKNIESRHDELEQINTFWAEINDIDLASGDIEAGKETFEMACTSCHGLKADGYEAPIDDETASEAYGVTIPDLSIAGAIYDDKFLAALILNPTQALKLGHKFHDDNPFPMTPFYGLGGDLNQEVADIVAYLKSVAPSNITDKEVFVDACLRCHDMKYDNLYSSSEKDSLKSYMGMTPPDLSIMIRARSGDYLETFLNDPQKNLPGTSMPRTGLNKQAQEQVVNYMESIGDSKKSQRETLGYALIGFFTILAILGYLWKREVWKDLH